MSRILRVGVLGAGRGISLGQLFDHHPLTRTVALCERDGARRERGASRLPHLEATYADYDAFLAHGLDIVVVANDATAHVPYVIKALEAGCHVLSELMACRSLAEAVALVRAVERADTLYFFAENCCWMRPVLEMKRLYREGLLGEYMYGECEYVHDCTRSWPRLTYGDPQHWRNLLPATVYCSHALGPMIEITGTRPISCIGLTTPNRLGQQVGRRGDDMGIVLCRMDNGAVTKVLVGMALRREPLSHWYSLYGTKGHVENERGADEDTLRLYLEDDLSEGGRRYTPSWPRRLDWTEDSGHGGADAQMIEDFVQAIIAGGPSPIDVYRALDMTLPGLLGHRSALQGGAPIAVPDLHDEALREHYQEDDWTPSGTPSAHGHISVPPEIYAAQKHAYRETFS